MSDAEDLRRAQAATCARYGAPIQPVPRHAKVGVARNVREGVLPINGLRHKPAGDTCGWFIWGGEEEPSTDPDFFVPLHVEHLAQWCPEVMQFLGLAPGWRFLVAGHYEDVWEDPSLLEL